MQNIAHTDVDSLQACSALCMLLVSTLLLPVLIISLSRIEACPKRPKSAYKPRLSYKTLQYVKGGPLSPVKIMTSRDLASLLKENRILRLGSMHQLRYENLCELVLHYHDMYDGVRMGLPRE